MRVLPDNLRSLLKEPFGELVNEKELIRILSSGKKFVSIGDQVTFTVLKYDLKPVFCVVDYKTKRGKCSLDIINLIKSYGEKSIIVKNPAGILSDELWDAIKNSYSSMDKYDGFRIEVDGEEDLASLAAIFLAPGDVTVIYGLPDKGVLVVNPDSDIKRRVKEIIDKM